MPRSRMLMVVFTLISFLLGIAPIHVHAQTPPTLSASTPDGKLVFDYPAEWTVNDLGFAPYANLVANSPDVFTEIQNNETLQTGQFVVVIYSADFLVQEFDVEYPITASDAAQLLYPFPPDNTDFAYDTPTAYFLGGRPTTRVDYTAQDTVGSAFFVEMEDGTVACAIGIGLPGEIETYMPTLFNIAQSLRLGYGVAVVTPPVTETPPTETPDTNPPTTVSTQRFVNQAGNLSFDYPGDWDAAESTSGISIAATAEIRERITNDPGAIQRGEFSINILGPTPLAEVLATAGTTTLEEATNAFVEQTSAQLNGQYTGPDSLTLGNNSALRYIITSDRVDYYVVVVRLADDQIVVMITIGLKGELIPYEAQILAIAASMQAGGSNTIALSPYTTTNGLFTMGLPEGWQVQELTGLIIAANSESALSHLSANQPLTAGEAGIIIYTTPLLEIVLPVPTNSLPVQALNGFTRAYQRPDVTFGPVQNPDAVTAYVTISGSSGDGTLYVINTHRFENTIFIGLAATGEYFPYDAVVKDVIASFVAVGAE